MSPAALAALAVVQRAALAQRRGVYPPERIPLTREQARRVYELVGVIDSEILRQERQEIEDLKNRGR